MKPFPKNYKELRLGDRVEKVKGVGYSQLFPVGSRGTIVGIASSCFIVKFDKGQREFRPFSEFSKFLDEGLYYFSDDTKSFVLLENYQIIE